MAESLTTLPSMRARRFSGLIFLLCIAVPEAGAESADVAFGGSLKSYLQLQQFSADSAFYEQAGRHSNDARVDLRLTAKARIENWSFNADYQLVANYTESESGSPLVIDGASSGGKLPDDRRRLFDLTKDLDASGRTQAVQRLDRFWVGYTTQHTVVRLGRLALSWGNGLLFSPMDIVNPFDPVAIDTEYKAGDDMAYAQHLLPSGNDFEAAWVIRRSPVTGDVDSNESTTALRFNALRGANEYQLLAARSYGNTVVGAGGSWNVGSAVWRADLVLNDADSWRVQFVTNTSYSWTWRGRNVTGSLEYFFNGFGLRRHNYDVAAVLASPQLAAQLARGETYSVGRHYFAGGLTLEISPLWLLSPSLFTNLADHSALLQLASQYSLGDNLSLLGALTLPIGPEGREFRGIRNSPGSNFLSRDAALFAQIAWYF